MCNSLFWKECLTLIKTFQNLSVILRPTNSVECFATNCRISIIKFPLLFSFLQSDPGFKFTPRSRDTLPAGFPHDIPSQGYFLDDYSPMVGDQLASPRTNVNETADSDRRLETNL